MDKNKCPKMKRVEKIVKMGKSWGPCDEDALLFSFYVQKMCDDDFF